LPAGKTRPTPFHREGIAEFDDFAGRSNAHSVWVTFLERDEGEGEQFFGVSGTDEMSIKYKRDKVGDHSGRYGNRRHKPLGHNSSSYE
jgi:hypothetical protein